eukprot:TRINITY_DN73_c0_g1_i5.p1 TRINITY_DN73_c0_g1~~TRINITY_DN73_c0_g1_i5.p1  ORF type:complete len:226 (+),score=30.09 TRINITY_DN73_c0_g1_i5:58-735(+)
MTLHFCRSWCVPEMLTVEDLRSQLGRELTLFTIVNTIAVVILLAVTDKTEAERSAAFAGIVLLWTAYPFGIWSLIRRNRGVMAVYVLYGLLAGVGKVVLTVVATVMVATSCQIEQSSFQGCGFAVVDELPCLANSTCSRDMINAYNDVANVMCEAWSTDDCSDAPSARTSMGFTGGDIALLVLDIFSSVVPVYIAFIFYIRWEASDPERDGEAETTVPNYQGSSL